MACNTNSACDACYNWGIGWISPLSFNNGACATVLSHLVTNCKIYNGITDTPATDTKCLVCENNYWLLWNQASSSIECQSE